MSTEDGKTVRTELQLSILYNLHAYLHLRLLKARQGSGIGKQFGIQLIRLAEKAFVPAAADHWTNSKI